MELLTVRVGFDVIEDRGEILGLAFELDGGKLETDVVPCGFSLGVIVKMRLEPHDTMGNLSVAVFNHRGQLIARGDMTGFAPHPGAAAREIESYALRVARVLFREFGEYSLRVTAVGGVDDSSFIESIPLHVVRKG